MIEVRRRAGLRTFSTRIARATRAVLADISWPPLVMALIAFGIDVVTPRAIIDSYVVAILLCLRARSPRAPLYVAGLCTPLMAIGYTLSPETGSMPMVSLINQLFMLVVIWASALIVSRMLHARAIAKEAQQRLQQEDRHKDEFLAILSHELRNPLAPIRTAADILAIPGVTAEQLHWASGMIKRQSVRMARLLDDLLDVARIAEGKLTLSVQLVSFGNIIDTAIEVARPAIDRKYHRLGVSLPAGPAALAGVLESPHQRRQVHRSGRTHRAHGHDRRWQAQGVGQGQWHRHSPGGAHPGIRPVLADGGGQDTRRRRHGNRPGPGQGHRGDARWNHRGTQPGARSWKRIHRDPAALRGAAERRAPVAGRLRGINRGGPYWPLRRIRSRLESGRPPAQRGATGIAPLSRRPFRDCGAVAAGAARSATRTSRRRRSTKRRRQAANKDVSGW